LNELSVRDEQYGWQHCLISGFRREVDEICAFLGC